MRLDHRLNASMTKEGVPKFNPQPGQGLNPWSTSWLAVRDITNCANLAHRKENFKHSQIIKLNEHRYSHWNWSWASLYNKNYTVLLCKKSCSKPLLNRQNTLWSWTKSTLCDFIFPWQGWVGSWFLQKSFIFDLFGCGGRGWSRWHRLGKESKDIWYSNRK